MVQLAQAPQIRGTFCPWTWKGFTWERTFRTPSPTSRHVPRLLGYVRWFPPKLSSPLSAALVGDFGNTCQTYLKAWLCLSEGVLAVLGAYIEAKVMWSFVKRNLGYIGGQDKRERSDTHTHIHTHYLKCLLRGHDKYNCYSCVQVTVGKEYCRGISSSHLLPAKQKHSPWSSILNPFKESGGVAAGVLLIVA